MKSETAPTPPAIETLSEGEPEDEPQLITPKPSDRKKRGKNKCSK